MMDESGRIIELLNELKQRDIRLWLEGNQLQFRAPNGAFTVELKDKVRANREQIIALLNRSFNNNNIGESIKSEQRGQDYYPLSFAQQRLWFFSQYDPNSSAYNCPAVITLPLEVGIDALEKAINYVVARHESLRTTFTLRGKDPVQIIQSGVEVPLEVHKLSNGTNCISVARDIIKRITTAPFDLERGPLFRCSLIKVEERACYLVLCIHHISTDGWSMKILQKDIAESYVAYAENRSPNLSVLPLQYVDYAVWQKSDIENRVIPQQLPYWSRVLEGSDSTLDLPLDYSRPPIKTNRGAIYRCRFDKLLTANIKKLAESQNVTLFMLLLAAFKILLMRYSRQYDINVGTPVANRAHSELESIVGFFVNTLVIRSQTGPLVSFKNYLDKLRVSCIEAYENQELPFEILVDKLKVKRDLSRNPFFQVMFALQNAQEVNVESNDTDNNINLELDFVKFDINVSVTEHIENLAIECEYSTELFKEQTITRMFRHYEGVLKSVVTDVNQLLGDIDYLGYQEKQQLIAVMRGKNKDYGNVTPIHKRFEMLVEKQPDALALKFEELSLTYAELNHKANKLTAVLIESGLKPAELCAICMERRAELVISIIAILKIGSAYLPIDPYLPSRRKQFFLDDSGANILLTSANYLVDFEVTEERTLLCVDQNLFVNEDFSINNHNAAVGPMFPAYAIYTSGSTGIPKGVVNNHLALFNRLAWMQENYPIGAGDRVLQKTNYAFDVSVWEFLWPLVEGAALILAEPEAHRDPGKIAQIIKTQVITVVHYVPSMFGLFLDEPSTSQLSSLKAIFCSGEALPWELVRKYRDIGLNAKLFNLYGPTEAAIDVTVWDCDNESIRSNTVPIGFPIANLSIYILDEQLNMQPIGVTGEIYIGGIGLATGYLNRPSLTAERFIADPMSAEPGQRMYRTGDLGRFLDDGSIEYLGRIDFQIKIRGLRVEIGEIESHLSDLENISQAAVVVAKNNTGEDVLVGYVLNQAENFDEENAKEALKNALPDYMLPNRIIVLPEFPLNSNGKLDRKALAALKYELPQNQEYIPPVTQTEQLIQGIWCEALQIQSVGATQNFFDLGGTSLNMVQVHKMLKESLEQEISLVKLFAHPTIRALAKFIEDNNSQDEDAEEKIEKMRIGNKRLVEMRNKRKKH